MNSKKNTNDETINLLDVCKYIIKLKKLVIMLTVAGLIVGIVFSVVAYLRGEMTKTYAIRTSIAVTSQTEDGLFTTHNISPDSTDIHLAEDMVDSVIFVIRSDRTLEKAVDQLQLIGITSKDIYDNLELTQYNETQIIDITLYWRNAEEGIKILDAINDVAPDILVDILKIGDVRVINDPVAKYRIGGSIKASYLAIATGIGLLAGIVISILSMLFRPTLVNSKDAKEKLGLTILGEIPRDKHMIANIELLMDRMLDLNNDVIDSYVSAAHILRKAADNQGAKLLFATSTAEGEGKTTVVANIGMQLADFEKKVLLIDMDVASPSLANQFIEHVEYEHSLNALYSGDVSVEDAIVPVNGYLDVLPLIHDNKGIILNEVMLQMIKEKAEEYDYTLIDTSAVGSSADILRLNRIADAAFFVIQYDKSTLENIQNALERLEKTDTTLLGCVITQTTSLS